MNITLAIESSALPYGIVLAHEGGILFNSLDNAELHDIKDVGILTQHALRATGRTAQDITAILINQGPGGTSSIRAGVAFANSLGYSLRVPVYAVNAFELMGFAAWQQHHCPVLVTVKSVKGNAYAGWFADGRLAATRYGLMAEVVKELVADTAELAVAGAHRAEVKTLFPQSNVIDTERKFGLASTLLDMASIWTAKPHTFPNFVIPITEQSSLFAS